MKIVIKRVVIEGKRECAQRQIERVYVNQMCISEGKKKGGSSRASPDMQKGKCQRSKERRYVQLVKISSMAQKSSSASAVERPFQDVRSAVERREKSFRETWCSPTNGKASTACS